MRSSDYGIADTDRTIEIKEGRGIILMQKNARDQNNNVIPDVVEEFEVKHVNKRQELEVPRGFFYALVNTSRDSILVAQHTGRSKEDSSSNNPNNNALKLMRGFAYRIVAADSHVCFQLNIKYMEENILKFKSGGIRRFGQNLD